MNEKKWIAGIGLAVAIAGGSWVVATVSPIGLAGAQDESDTSQEESAEEDRESRPRPVLGEVLDELVADGTIDQADADAVEEAMEARWDEFRANHPGPNGAGHDPTERLDDAQTRLDDAIADGSISDERATRIQERIDRAPRGSRAASGSMSVRATGPGGATVAHPVTTARTSPPYPETGASASCRCLSAESGRR